MEVGNLLGIVFTALFVGGAFLTIRALVRQNRNGRANAARSEALFASMFTELQPHLHPKNVIEYVLARVQRGRAFKATEWANPPASRPRARRFFKSPPKGSARC